MIHGAECPVCAPGAPGTDRAGFVEMEESPDSNPPSDSCPEEAEAASVAPSVPGLSGSWARFAQRRVGVGDTARAMSQENVEIVRLVYKAVSRRDTAAVLDLYDSAIEWRPWQDLTGRGVYRGHEDLKAFYRAWHEAWGDYEENYDELIDAGDHVVVVATGRGRGQASGVEVAWTQYGMWTIRDGKVTRVVWFPTREEALQAAGLREWDQGPLPDM